MSALGSAASGATEPEAAFEPVIPATHARLPPLKPEVSAAARGFMPQLVPRSLFVFSRQNPIRRACVWLVRRVWFDRISL
jgi:hypothetical protein